MNKYFDDNGHLTDYALKAVISDEPLDELSRLEISEHLSFCDECIVRYSEMLTDDVLIEPKESSSAEIISKIKAKARLIFFNKYVAVGMAASIALVLWVTGVFTPWNIDEMDNAMTSISEKSNDFNDKSAKFVSKINDALNDFFKKTNQ